MAFTDSSSLLGELQDSHSYGDRRSLLSCSLCRPCHVRYPVTREGLPGPNSRVPCTSSLFTAPSSLSWDGTPPLLLPILWPPVLLFDTTRCQVALVAQRVIHFVFKAYMPHTCSMKAPQRTQVLGLPRTPVQLLANSGKHHSDRTLPNCHQGSRQRGRTSNERLCIHGCCLYPTLHVCVCMCVCVSTLRPGAAVGVKRVWCVWFSLFLQTFWMIISCDFYIYS